MKREEKDKKGIVLYSGEGCILNGNKIIPAEEWRAN
jgi:hypothetical protein